MPSDLELLQKQTKANTESIKELVGIVGNISSSITTTSKDVDRTSRDLDKLSGYIMELIPVNKMIAHMQIDISDIKKELDEGVKPRTLKNLLIFGCSGVFSFGIWITLSYFALDKQVSSYIEKEDMIQSNMEIKISELIKEIEDNSNQISYNKGIITNLKKVNQ